MKRSFYLSLFLLFLILTASATSAPISTCLWQATGSGVRLVIPANFERKTLSEGDFCRAAVQLYVDAVNANADLRNMMGGRTLPIPSGSKFSLLMKKVSPRPRMIILANEFEQMVDPGEFVMSTMVGQFTSAGADVYALPVASTISLGGDANAFRNLIAEDFDSMLAIGGEDIDPSLYGQQITNAHAQDIHRVRDSHEREFHRAYVARGKGVFFGICRGHQLAAVSLGQKLIQDIYTPDRYNPSAHTATPHQNGVWHEIQISEDSIFARWAVTEVKNGKRTMWVNSFHHEAVSFPLTIGPKNLRVTGLEQDHPELGDSRKIIEIIESSDGRYITMQFHPEGMDQDMHDNGKRIRMGMIQHVNQMRKR